MRSQRKKLSHDGGGGRNQDLKNGIEPGQYGMGDYA